MPTLFSRTQVANSRFVEDFPQLIASHFEALLTDKGDLNESFYDLAWVVCTDFFSAEQQQEQIRWLISQQSADGLWGFTQYSPHSSLLDTLAVTMALLWHGQTIPKFAALEASLDRLVQACIENPQYQTVAFEFLAPLLFQFLAEQGLFFNLTSISAQYLAQEAARAKAKLAHLAATQDGLYSVKHSLGFSAEIFMLQKHQVKDVLEIRKLLMPNGSVGLSPAATAGVILLSKQNGLPVPPELYDYLRTVYTDYEAHHFVNWHPATQTRRLWNLLPWILSKNESVLFENDALLSLLREIYAQLHLDENGCLAWDVSIASLPDLDNTAVGYALHCLLGEKLGNLLNSRFSSYAFKQFQRSDGTVFCYPHELHPSLSALLHNLMALDIAETTIGKAFFDEPYHTTLKAKLLESLNPSGKDFDMLTHDKWHTTWAYGVQRWLCVHSIQKAYPETIIQMIETCISRQAADGGWGEYVSSLEESSYVILGLLAALKSEWIYIDKSLSKQLEATLQNAQRFMGTALNAEDAYFPTIWICKNLYLPVYQVFSSIICAMYALKTWQKENSPLVNEMGNS